MDNKEHMNTKRIFKNLSVVYRELFRYARQSIWQLPLYALVCIILPLLLSAIPAVAIEMLTQDDLGRYVFGISALLAASTLLTVIRIFLGNRFDLNIMRPFVAQMPDDGFLQSGAGAPAEKDVPRYVQCHEQWAWRGGSHPLFV